MKINCNDFLHEQYSNSRGEAEFKILNSNIKNNRLELYQSLNIIFDKLESKSYIHKVLNKTCDKMNTIDIGDKYLNSSLNPQLGFELIVNHALFNSLKFSTTENRKKFIQHIKKDILSQFSLIEISFKNVCLHISNTLLKEREYIPFSNADCSIGNNENKFLAKLIFDNFQTLFPQASISFKYNFVEISDLKKIISMVKNNHYKICEDINKLPNIETLKFQSFLLNKLTIDEYNNYFQSMPNNRIPLIKDNDDISKILSNLNPNELRSMYNIYSYKEQKSLIKNKIKIN